MPTVGIEELLRRYVDAMGAEEALAKIKCLDCSGTIQITQPGWAKDAPLTFAGMSRRVVIPSKAIYACDTWGITRDEWGWRGAIAWRNHSQDGLRRLHGVDESFVKHEASLVPLSDAYACYPDRMQQEPIENLTETNVPCYVVSITDSNGHLSEKAILAGDHAKHPYLIVERVLQKGLPFVAGWPIRIRILDYVTVAGVKVPCSIRAESDPMTVEWNYTEFAVNEQTDATLFEPPNPILRYTRSYLKLIGKLLDGELTPRDFKNRFDQLFKWEPTDFPIAEYEALERLRRCIGMQQAIEKKPSLPQPVLEAARQARAILEAPE